MSSMCRALIWINLVRCLVSFWSSSSSSRTAADYGFAVGSYNGTITLIGGSISPRGLTTYDIQLDVFSDESSPLTADIYGLTQFYTQSAEDIVYMLSAGDTASISTYDLATNVFVSSFATDPDYNDPGPLGCLTAVADSLFILGGGMTLGSDSLNTFQILHIPSGNWTLTAPLMGTARAGLACIAHSGHIWALGGSSTETLNSTERIATRGTITNNAWGAYVSLLDPVVYATAVDHKDRIYIIGGLSAAGAILNTVQIIDTMAQVVTRDDLAYAVDAVGGTYSDPFLYAFGGRTADNPVVAKATFLSFDTTTVNPTQTPSQPPSTDPSAAPTGNPSTPPTGYPSTAPSSRAPTRNPSIAPSTDAPTRHPSVPPTRNPSGAPTDSPSGVSLQPSVAPSNVPTETPVEAETTEEGGESSGEDANAQKDEDGDMGLVMGLGIAGVVLLIALLLFFLYWNKRKDRQYEDEKKVKAAVRGQMEEQVMQTGGLNEKDVLEQVLALSAYEQRKARLSQQQGAGGRNRNVSLQGQPQQQAKPATKVDPASDLGAVKEDDTMAMPETADKETEKADDKGKQSDALLSDGSKDKDTGTELIAVDTASDHGDEKANELVTDGGDEKGKQGDKDEAVVVEMVEKEEKEEKEETEANDNDKADAAPSAVEEP